MRTRIKVCGITRLFDAVSAAGLGVDAIGLVFYSNSPRKVNIKEAQRIAAELPPFISVVGLFVDSEADFIHDVIASVALDLLQFHGNESAQFCRQFGVPYIKAVRMSPDKDLTELSEKFSDARGLLLDAYEAGVPGGTGKTFEWSEELVKEISCPIILAGGLNATNVRRAIKTIDPWAVDISSGVESKPGVKDFLMMSEFVKKVSAVKRGVKE